MDRRFGENHTKSAAVTLVRCSFLTAIALIPVRKVSSLTTRVFEVEIEVKVEVRVEEEEEEEEEDEEEEEEGEGEKEREKEKEKERGS
ncbi:hypothetical protein V1477_000269 [Vespula maculifrons]|uniref:Uncharacterized protein n=1 Tax=Vespula maculifrons TaxID=7453 RepID=A0ABD2D1D4_VESMC